MTDDEFRAKFSALTNRWLGDTRFISSMTKITAHPAYAEIIRMGPAVVPLILADLEREPKHWDLALEAITGVNPVPKEHAGQVNKIAEDWLRWGRDTMA